MQLLLGNSYEVEASESHNATVIFLHGLGGSGPSAYRLMTEYVDMPSLRHVKWIFPTSPELFITIAGKSGPAWYDIKGMSVTEYILNKVEDTSQIKSSAKAIHDLVDAEIDGGISSDRIVIAGASQGGAMALYSALTYSQSLAGVLAINSYLPNARNFLWCGSVLQPSETPVLMCHGQEDNVVNHVFGKLSYYYMKLLGLNIRFNSYADLDHHETSEQQIADIQEYLDHLLGGSDS